MYTKTYVGQYSRQFEGSFNKQFEGSFESEYGQAYTKQYEGQFDKQYEGTFDKNYGGVYAGPGTSYEGIRLFTSTYLGATDFNKTYVSTTDVANTKSGELTSGGTTRVREDGTLKKIETVRVKSGDEWKEVLTSRVKEDGEWKVSHVGYERSTIDITANTTNYNLRTELDALGKSTGSIPQHVTVTIAADTFLFADNGQVFITAANQDTRTPALDLSSMITIAGGLRHKVKLLIKEDGGIIGSGGQPGDRDLTTRTGENGYYGSHAIKTNDAVDLFIENYGTIAGGGGGGGSGGYPISGSTLSRVGGQGGIGAGYHNAVLMIDNVQGYVDEANSNITAHSSSYNYGIHGGDGGLLGHAGIGAGGWTDEVHSGDADQSETNPGTIYSQYALSGDGGLPGSAIKGYDAARITFINTGNVYGDSKFKYTAS